MSNNITLSTANDSPLAVRANRAQFPRIKDTTPKEGLERMTRILIGTQVYANRKIGKEELAQMSKALYAELMADDFCRGTRNLAWIDIQRAIRRGVLGLGKEMYGISVATLFQAILDYLDEEVRPAQDKLRRMKAEAEQRGVSMESIINAYASMMEKANNEKLNNNGNESELPENNQEPHR